MPLNLIEFFLYAPEGAPFLLESRGYPSCLWVYLAEKT